MSKTQVKLDVAEAVEPTLEEVEKQAARQLLNEMFMIKRRIYGIPMNGVLLIQVKQLVRGLMRKYQEFELFTGEDIEVKFFPKRNAVEFFPTAKLQVLFDTVVNEVQQKVADDNKVAV